MAGAPSQLDLFDHKPMLQKHDGEEIPAGIIPEGERFAFVRGTPRLLGSPFKFAPHGQSGNEISELLPHLQQHRRRDRDHPVDEDDAVQPRAGADLHEHRASGDRPPEHGLVAQLRPGQRQQGPAGVRRADVRARTTRTAARAAGAAAFCRPCTRASSSAPRASRCCSLATRTAWTAGPRRESLDLDSRAQHAARAQRVGDPEIDHAHRGLRDGVPDADERARS